MQALIIFGILGAYGAIAVLIYCVLNYIEPYKPESDYWSDGDSNKMIAFMWPVLLPFLIFFSPFILMYHVFEKIRKTSETRKSKTNKIWEELTRENELSEAGVRDLQSYLTDLFASSVLKPEIGEGIVTIKYMIGDNPKLSLIGRVNDYEFLCETAKQNNILNNLIRDIKFDFRDIKTLGQDKPVRTLYIDIIL